MITLDAPTLPTAGLTTLDRPATAPRAGLRLTRRIASRRFVRLEQAAAAVRALSPLPVPGESLHGVTDGTYSGWSLATACIQLLAEPVAEMIVATLGFNRPNCSDLCEAIDAGKVRSVLLLVSDYFRSSDRTVFADCRRELEARGQRVAIARSHAKLILLRTAGRSIVCETSANLRGSTNYEQFTLCDDAALFDFHRRWILELVGAA